MSLHEVYYSEAGKPNGFTVKPAVPLMENPEELRWYVEQMLVALDKPVLSVEDFSTSFNQQHDPAGDHLLPVIGQIQTILSIMQKFGEKR